MELQKIEKREPLEAGLTHPDDRIRLSEWLPPQWGEMPRIRFWKRWYNVLWIIPLGIAGLIIGVALAQDLRQNYPGVQQFIARYPGISAAPKYYKGFPAWLRWQHFFNLFLMFLMIRAGIQILADHPRLYWNRDCTPGTEWFRFQHEVPMDRIWTAKDDSVTLPGWFGIPGIRHLIGLARWWHFSCDLLWVLNGAVFYVLLFTTYQWQRIVPQAWAIFPSALSTAIQYASLHFPADQGWIRYNGLELLSYFITVFIAAPLAIITGLMQAPAISNRLGWLGRVLHRQAARSIHFMVLCWFVFFIFIHVTMIFVTGLRQNLNHMFAGVNGNGPEGFVIFCIAMLAVMVVWFAASPFTLRHARLVQKTASSWSAG